MWLGVVVTIIDVRLTAKPKSNSFTVPLESKPILVGLRSRKMIILECRYYKASAIETTTLICVQVPVLARRFPPKTRDTRDIVYTS